MIPLEPDRDISYLHYEEGYSFPNETYTGLASLCTILQGIQDRLIREGYSIIEGEVIPPQRVEHYEKSTIYSR